MHYEIKVHEYFKKQVFEDNIFLIELKQVVSIWNLILLNRNVSRIGSRQLDCSFLKVLGTLALLWHSRCSAVGTTYSHPCIQGLYFIMCKGDLNFIVSSIYLPASPYLPFQLMSLKNTGTVWEPTYSQEQIKLLLSYLRVFTTSH